MSLTIELSPVEEQRMYSFAQKAGVPVADFARRLFIDALQQKAQSDEQSPLARRQARRAEIAQSFAASGTTEAELEQHAQKIVDEVRTAEYARDNQPL